MKSKKRPRSAIKCNFYFIDFNSLFLEFLNNSKKIKKKYKIKKTISLSSPRKKTKKQKIQYITPKVKRRFIIKGSSKRPKSARKKTKSIDFSGSLLKKKNKEIIYKPIKGKAKRKLIKKRKKQMKQPVYINQIHIV